MSRSIILFFTSAHLLAKSLSTYKAIIIILSLLYNLRETLLLSQTQFAYERRNLPLATIWSNAQQKPRDVEVSQR